MVSLLAEGVGEDVVARVFGIEEKALPRRINRYLNGNKTWL
jgi:hypothetical protein